VFRVLVREIGRAFIALVALVGAGVALAVSSGDSRTFGRLWARLPGLVAAAARGDAAGVSALVRLGAYAVVALLALSLVGRLVGDALFARRRGYSLPAHLAQALRLRAVRLAAAGWGVILAVAQGGSASAAAAGRSPAPSGGARVALTTALPTRTVEQGRTTHGAAVVRDTADRDRAERPGRPADGRVVVTRTRRVKALRYTVQPGDTLGDIAYRLNPADPTLSTRIFRLTRGLPQRGLPPVTDPNLIFPGQTLLAPLPLPHVAVVDGHIRVQAQPGDTEGAIAARLLGDWRRYPELTPVHAATPDPDLIPVGVVFQLPASAAVVEVRITRRYVARLRPAPPRAWHGHSGRRSPPAGRANVGGDGTGAGARHHAHSGRRRARAGHPTVGASGPGIRPKRHVHPRGHVHPAGHAHPTGHAYPRGHVHPTGHVHPKGHVHPTGSIRPKNRIVPVHHTAPWSGRAAPRDRRPVVATPAHAPTSPPLSMVRMPGAPRYLPLALVAALALLVAAAGRQARRRSSATSSGAATPTSPPAPHGATPTSPPPPRATTPTSPPPRRSRHHGADGASISSSMQRMVAAVNAGVGGPLLAALKRTPPAWVAAGHLVPTVLGVLSDEGRASGRAVVGGLAASTRAVLDGQDTLSVHLDAAALPDGAPAGLIAGLTHRLGTPVQTATARDADGTSVVMLTMRKAPLLAAGLTPPLVGAHPAPLLVPLGTATGKGHKGHSAAVVYVNLARTGALLIAGGAQGSHTLVATLLADIVPQARPSALRVLVATDDDELRRMLPALDHLDAPAVDVDQRQDVAALVDQANAIVLERFTRGANDTAQPIYVLVLSNVEELCLDPRVADRLDTICRNGAGCGVYVIGTTYDAVALADAGMLDAFPARLARPLPREESVALFGDARAAELASGDVVFAVGPQMGAPVAPLVPGQLTPFSMTLPEAQEAFAWAAQALQADPAMPAPDPDDDPPPDPDAAAKPDSDAAATLDANNAPTLDANNAPAPHSAAPARPKTKRALSVWRANRRIVRDANAANGETPETDQAHAADPEAEDAAANHGTSPVSLVRSDADASEANGVFDVQPSMPAPATTRPGEAEAEAARECLPAGATGATGATGTALPLDQRQPPVVTRERNVVADVVAAPAERQDAAPAERQDATPAEAPAPIVTAETPHPDILPVRVRVFGGISVTLANGEAIPKLKPREQRLLAALAILPSPVRVDRLMSILWPDEDLETAKQNLERSISDVRAALARVGVPVARGGGSRRAGAIVLTSAGYALDSTIMWTDTQRLQQLLRQAQALLPDERGPVLTEAVDLYKGDLCGDQSLSWVDDYTWSWRKDFVDALYDVTAATLRTGDLSTALRHARRLVREEPLVERHHQLLFEALARRGDRDGLKEAYRELLAEFNGDGEEGSRTEMDPAIHRVYTRLLDAIGVASGVPTGTPMARTEQEGKEGKVAPAPGAATLAG